jgi:cysteine desulfurase
MIYLDNAATTQTSPDVLKAAWPWMTTEFGNASSHHELGNRAADVLQQSRQKVAQFLACNSSEVIFTSGGTESDNLGVIGLALANPRGRHIITSPTEHEAVLASVEYLQRVHGFNVTYLSVDETGAISPDHLQEALRPDTTLVTLMLGNNEVGTIHPIAEFCDLAHEVGALFHCDAVQGVGWVPIDVGELGIDALSISGHKFHAPKGIGALYLNRRIAVEPLIHGGGQEHGRRSGTENIAMAVALAEALEQIDFNNADRIRVLRDKFIAGVLESIPHAQLTGHPTERMPHIASFVFKSVSGEAVLIALEEKGILCSSGSACAAGSDEPSHVLIALGHEPDLAKTAVRFSFSHTTTEQELDQTLLVLQDYFESINID